MKSRKNQLEGSCGIQNKEFTSQNIKNVWFSSTQDEEYANTKTIIDFFSARGQDFAIEYRTNKKNSKGEWLQGKTDLYGVTKPYWIASIF